MEKLFLAVVAASVCLVAAGSSVGSSSEEEGKNATAAVGNFTFTYSNGTTCFFLRAQITYSVTQGGKTSNGFINANDTATRISGNCSDAMEGNLVESGIVIENEEIEIQLRFLKNSTSKTWTGIFSELVFFGSGDSGDYSVGSGAELTAPGDQGLGCSKIDVPINGTAGKGNITLTTLTLKPGFVDMNKEVAQCANDKEPATSNVVPIAVGCALAGLVLIVLVAYLIGRTRHARQHKGYQSV